MNIDNSREVIGEAEESISNLINHNPEAAELLKQEIKIPKSKLLINFQ
jgi:hypothetical protein